MSLPDDPIKAPQPPGRDVWEQISLPLQLHGQENIDHYHIFGTIPGLHTKNLQIAFDRETRELLIEGVRLPTAKENLAMQSKVAVLLETHVKHACKQTLPQRAMQGLGLKLYIDLGEGLFGRFVKTSAIPHDIDVDVKALSFSYEHGILRVVLPKMLPSQSGKPFSRKDLESLLSAAGVKSGVRAATLAAATAATSQGCESDCRVGLNMVRCIR